MPLVYPYTVATGFQAASISWRSGPFVPTAGVRYLAMQDWSTGQICIFKSTDTGQTWAIQDNSNAPSFDESVSLFGLVLAIQDDTDIWILVDHAGYGTVPTCELTAYRFDTTTDLWVRTDDTGGTFTSDGSGASGNFHVHGMRINEGTVQIYADMINDATSSQTEPILMTQTIGVSGWSWVYFPDLDGTNNLRVLTDNRAELREGVMHTISHFTKFVYVSGISCFASSAEYVSINDIRAHEIDTASSISGYLDGCLARASTTEEALEIEAFKNVNGGLWHVYIHIDIDTLVYTLHVCGPDTGSVAYADITTLTFGPVTRPYKVWLGRSGLYPVMIVATYDEGFINQNMLLSTFDGTNWSAFTDAIDTFPDFLPDNIDISMEYTEAGAMGVLQGEQYWEYKFDGPNGLITPDFLESTESIPRPTIILGDAPLTAPKSRWYTY